MKKNEAELDLRESLLPGIDRLTEEPGRAGSLAYQSTKLREQDHVLRTVDQKISRLDQLVRDTDMQIETTASQLADLETAKTEKEASNRQLAKATEKHDLQMRRKDTDRMRYTSELEAVGRAIREIGTLPEDVHHKYKRWDTAKVRYRNSMDETRRSQHYR